MHALAILSTFLALGAPRQDAEGYVRSADAKYKARDIEGALADYAKAIQLDPKCAAAYFGRGVLRANKGEIDPAIADYTAAVGSDPKHAKAWFNRGMMRMYKGDEGGAIADLTRAIEADPVYRTAYFNRGLLRAGRRDHDGAIADYTKAIDLSSSDADGYFNRGNSWAAKGDHDRAIADYSKAVELKPKYGAAYIYRGESHARKGDLAGAVVDYSRAIELNPKDAEAYYSRGHANYDRQMWTDALADLQKAWDLNGLSRLHTDYCQLRLWLVRARLGDEAAATKDFKLFLKARGRPVDWFSRIAGFLVGDSSEEEFMSAAQAALQMGDFYFYAGTVRLVRKDKARAQAYFQKCLETDSAGPELASARAELQALKTGK